MSIVHKLQTASTRSRAHVHAPPGRPAAVRPGGEAAAPEWRRLRTGGRWFALLGVLAMVLVGVAAHQWFGHEAASVRRAPLEVGASDSFWDALWFIGAAAGLVALLALALFDRALQRLQQRLQADARRADERLNAVYRAHAAQLEALRREAHVDPLTGMPARRHFIAQFEQLVGSGSGRIGLMVLRVRDLAGMNRRIGHEAADHVLQAVAQSLLRYPCRTDGCFAGRLNGSDFALVLPVGGMVGETAGALVQALQLPLVAIDAAASVAVGAVEAELPASVAQMMAAVDEALAGAEAGPSFGVVCHAQASPEAAGQTAWQQRLAEALDNGRVALARYPVCTADGRVLHLDCPLRIELEPGSTGEAAARWLPMATRARLCAAADERALALALQAIEHDEQARCINFAAQSLGRSDFMAAVSQRLEASPQAATRLWIDLPESLALDRPALVREATRRWRPLGVYIGLEHAGDALARIPGLMELGLDVVRVDARFVQGIADAGCEDARRYLRGLVQLVQGVGLAITAEGVRREQDLELLWSLGFDAATGPVFQPMSAQCSG